MLKLGDSEVVSQNLRERAGVLFRAWGLGLLMTLLAVLWLTLVATTWAGIGP